MAVYVYRRVASDSARMLADALNGRRWRGLQTPIERRVQRGDVVICWGETLPAIPHIRILNGAPIQNKWQDIVALRAANVPTVEAGLTRPAPRPAAPLVDPAIDLFRQAIDEAEEFVNLFETPPANLRNRVMQDGVNSLGVRLAALVAAIQRPVPVAPPVVDGEWLPRLNNHVGGNDLLHPPTTPNYWVKKEDIVEEVRIHSFVGRSIRAGAKRPVQGQVQHAWIRSEEGGWKIIYDGVTARQAHRDLAHRAVTALGLDFGAVDIGVLRNGNLIVLEVNRAPGLGEGTCTRYVSAIQRWINGELAQEAA